MALDEVVELMKGDAWPAGYQPLAVMASVVSGGVMRKHIRWLTGVGIVHIRHHTRQEAVLCGRQRGMLRGVQVRAE